MNKIIKGILIGTAVIALAATGGYYGYGAYHYHTHFYGGSQLQVTSPDGAKVLLEEDLSEIAADDVCEQIVHLLDDYELNIESVKGTKDVMTAEDAGYQVDPESVEALRHACRKQNFLLWPMYMTGFAQASHPASYTVTVSFDESKADAALSQMKCLVPEQVEDGEDAYLDYNKETCLYEVIDAVTGNTGDKTIIEPKVMDALRGLETVIELEDGDYIKPEVQADNPALVAKRDEINKYLSARITLKFGNKSTVVDGSKIINFLDIDDEWNVKLNEDKVKSYINRNFDPIFDSVGSKRTIKTAKSGTVTVSGGTFGSTVRTSTEVVKLMEEIANGETVERAPCFYTDFEKETNGGVGDTYIDVNLKKQKVYVVKDGKVVITSDCVSGQDTKERRTPTGVYYVARKATEYTMVKYQAFVHYWLPIDDGTGVGLHDATWRGSFGGNIYKSNGSHGCINLPLDNAKKIFDAVSPGIPVIVHN